MFKLVFLFIAVLLLASFPYTIEVQVDWPQAYVWLALVVIGTSITLTPLLILRAARKVRNDQVDLIKRAKSGPEGFWL